ncbi:Cellulase (glycosyl hydrolase family 5 protein) [Ceratobasidium sp. AG-Ba]|nr:Cellulase (glycosyl hydrolase family 5 protein) [Ceratobasidium sp. AG-Ba]
MIISHPSLGDSYEPGSGDNHQAHDWSRVSTGSAGVSPRLDSKWIVDSYGRVCLMRGTNLSGGSKIPANHSPSSFPYDYTTVTFVERPFPLEEAPQHFARLRRWGLTFIRFNVTWEAIEHEGPSKYDTEYLAYIRSLLSLLPQFGLVAFVSLHQDVWSRYSGGSGAPAWTLEAAGFDLGNIGGDCGAAYLGGVEGTGVEVDRGRWPTGYQKLAASTMATLFWAGRTYAPKLLVPSSSSQNVNIQDFLQDCFLNAFDELVKATGDLEGVIGFEMMNEPHRGYVSIPSLHAFDYTTDLHLHDTPNALQSFALGAGHAVAIPHYVRSWPFPTRVGKTVLRNEKGIKAWRTDGPTKGECVWEMHGVWGWDKKKKEGVPLRESYFKNHPQTGKEVEWHQDFFYPFVGRWSERVHALTGGKKMVFLEAIPNEFCPSSWTSEKQPANMVFAPHWYDLNALFKKQFGFMSINVQGLARGMFPLRALYWGHEGARKNYTLQIGNIVKASDESLKRKRPVIIGECGIPMDMNEGKAFVTGDFEWHTRMMDALMTALERSLVGFTLWNYNPDNDDVHGDFWNGENFSWFSRCRADSSFPANPHPSLLDQSFDALDTGARLLPVIVRPYPAKIAGVPLEFKYEPRTGAFKFKFDTSLNRDLVKARETEVFIPASLVEGRKLLVSGTPSLKTTYDASRQTLFVVHSQAGVHTLDITFDPPLGNEFVTKELGLGWLAWLFAFITLVLGWVLVRT